MNDLTSTIAPSAPTSVAIAGGGLMGATLAYRYAKSHPDTKLTLLEKLPEDVFTAATEARTEGYALSSSQAGDLTTRSIRASLQEKNNLDLVTATRDLYLDLQKQSDKPLFVGAASVNVIDVTDQEAMAELDMQKKRFEHYGMGYKLYSDKNDLLKDHPEYTRLFANARYPGSYVILHEDAYHPEHNPNGVSGTVDPAAVLEVLHKNLKQLPNVDVQYGATVNDVRVLENGKAELAAGDRTVAAERAVLSVGPWLQQLEPGLQGLPKVKPNRVTYANIPLEGQATMPPFIKGLGVTTLAATMKPDANGLYPVKKLMPEKETIKIGADGLQSRPITADEIQAATADLEEAHGIVLNDNERAGITGSSGIVSSSHGKRAVIDYAAVKGNPAGQSPVLVHGMDNHTMATVVGGAAEVAAAKLDGKGEPYRGSFSNYAANNPLQYPEAAHVPASAEITSIVTPKQELSK